MGEVHHVRSINKQDFFCKVHHIMVLQPSSTPAGRATQHRQRTYFTMSSDAYMVKHKTTSNRNSKQMLNHVIRTCTSCIFVIIYITVFSSTHCLFLGYGSAETPAMCGQHRLQTACHRGQDLVLTLWTLNAKDNHGET